jgi:hypothetical protein
MTVIPPMPFRWDGEALRPLRPREADRFYVVGEVYRMIEHQDRSQASHAHYFAAINEAWSNLPDHLAEQLPTPEHLRKFALIKAGYADQRQLVASSKAEALRLAAFVRPCDPYAVVTVRDAVVTIYTAQSQSHRAMGKKVFQESKDKVLGVVAQMIGTTPQALAQNAGQAA